MGQYSVIWAKLFFLVCVVPCLSMSLSAAEYRLSIADIETFAEKQSLALKAQDAEVRAVTAEIGTARLWDNPEMGLQYDYHAITPANANNPATIDARISQPLQLFGLRDAKIEQARSNAFQAFLQSAEFRRNFLLQVRLSAYKLLVLNTALNFQKAFYENYQKLLQANNFRYRKGDISEYELKKLQVEGTRYENSIVVLDVEIKRKTNDLKKALSLPESDLLVIEDELKPPEATAVNTILEQDVNPELRSDILAARNEIALAERSLNVAEKENMPDFSAAALYHYEPGSALFARNHYFGLGVTAPLKILNRNQGRREAAKHMIEKKTLSYRQELLNARAEMAAQRNAIRQYLGVLISGTSRLALSQEVYEKGRLLYTKKAANLIQLLESERSYFEIQREYFEILYNFQESFEIYLALTKTMNPDKVELK
jgi:cobalt-zinc-cadmium efflux system outer membrane protein